MECDTPAARVFVDVDDHTVAVVDPLAGLVEPSNTTVTVTDRTQNRSDSTARAVGRDRTAWYPLSPGVTTELRTVAG